MRPFMSKHYHVRKEDVTNPVYALKIFNGILTQGLTPGWDQSGKVGEHGEGA